MTEKKQEPTTVKLTHPSLLKNKQRCAVSGSKNDDFVQALANQIAYTAWLGNSTPEEADRQKIAALVGVMGASPQDEIEGMLAAQMMAAHNASMECYRRAMHREQPFAGREMNLSQASKLSRTYATMMEALGRYRGKGQQRIIVQHVNVENGGQAIVGNVTHPEGGGVQTKTGEQAHAITHAPEQAVPSQNTQNEPVPVPRDA